MHVLDVMRNESETALAKALRAEKGLDRFVLDLDGDDYEGPVNAWASNWSEINIHVIDGEAMRWLKHGNCAALAWELHVLTGLPLTIVMLNEESEQNWAHVVLQLDDDKYLDIEGVMSKSAMLNEWRASIGVRNIDPTNADDMAFLTATCASKYSDFVEGLDDFYDDVERELIRDFARMLVAEHIK